MTSSGGAKNLGGRPATGIGTSINVRLQPGQLAALDAYAAKQPDPKPSRPEMIRKILKDRLVHEGLIEAGPEVGTRT